MKQNIVIEQQQQVSSFVSIFINEIDIDKKKKKLSSFV
jgi:hypothetical protein